MILSIVITTYNRRDVLRELLLHLERQTDTAFEVVVAVDGSTDGTQEFLEDYRKHSAFEIRWVNTGLCDSYGLATARNQGICEARGEAVVILDDDSFPVVDFVFEHKKTLREKTLTGGWRESSDPNDSLHKKMCEYMEVYGDSQPRPFQYFIKHKNPYVVENNTCMYKTDWIESGLFDESIQKYGGIGQEFVARLAKQGYDYQFNPRAAIVHHVKYKRHYGPRWSWRKRLRVWYKTLLSKFKLRE